MFSRNTRSFCFNTAARGSHAVLWRFSVNIDKRQQRLGLDLIMAGAQMEMSLLSLPAAGGARLQSHHYLGSGLPEAGPGPASLFSVYPGVTALICANSVASPPSPPPHYTTTPTPNPRH